MNDPYKEVLKDLLNNLHKDNKIILQDVQIQKMIRVGNKLSRALFNISYDDHKLIINEWEEVKPKQSDQL